MKPMPIRYVHDMAAAQAFYEALGLTLEVAQRPPKDGPQPHWIELAGSAGTLALHYVPPGATAPPVELAFDSDQPLEDVTKRLRAAGFEPETSITDEAFGRSFKVRDPGGLLIQINEHDRGLTS
jgi:catechol 2,3-dioxygenase-like lactoylglutathione lyase family enzyme